MLYKNTIVNVPGGTCAELLCITAYWVCEDLTIAGCASLYERD